MRTHKQPVGVGFIHNCSQLLLREHGVLYSTVFPLQVHLDEIGAALMEIDHGRSCLMRSLYLVVKVPAEHSAREPTRSSEYRPGTKTARNKIPA